MIESLEGVLMKIMESLNSSRITGEPLSLALSRMREREIVEGV